MPTAEPLHAYRHARLIVQNARTTVFEAARAMQTNAIGCVVVTEGSAIVGLVTDRDIAVRVVAAARDPRRTALRDVMSRDLATLPPDAGVRDALRVMRERAVRRVPLIERGRLVGMVTLDDLLFEKAAPLDAVVAVVRAQMIDTGPARTRRFDEWHAMERRYARAWATRTKMVSEVQKAGALEDREEAASVLWIVLSAIVRRVPPTVATTMLAQLPALLRSRLAELPPGPDPSIGRDEIDSEVARELGVTIDRAAVVVDAVGGVLVRRVPGVGAIVRRLPADLRAILRPSGSRAAAYVTAGSRSTARYTPTNRPSRT